MFPISELDAHYPDIPNLEPSSLEPPCFKRSPSRIPEEQDCLFCLQDRNLEEFGMSTSKPRDCNSKFEYHQRRPCNWDYDLTWEAPRSEVPDLFDQDSLVVKSIRNQMNSDLSLWDAENHHGHNDFDQHAATCRTAPTYAMRKSYQWDDCDFADCAEQIRKEMFVKNHLTGVSVFSDLKYLEMEDANPSACNSTAIAGDFLLESPLHVRRQLGTDDEGSTGRLKWISELDAFSSSKNSYFLGPSTMSSISHVESPEPFKRRKCDLSSCSSEDFWDLPADGNHGRWSSGKAGRSMRWAPGSVSPEAASPNPDIPENLAPCTYEEFSSFCSSKSLNERELRVMRNSSKNKRQQSCSHGSLPSVAHEPPEACGVKSVGENDREEQSDRSHTPSFLHHAESVTERKNTLPSPGKLGTDECQYAKRDVAKDSIALDDVEVDSPAKGRLEEAAADMKKSKDSATMLEESKEDLQDDFGENSRNSTTDLVQPTSSQASSQGATVIATPVSRKSFVGPDRASPFTRLDSKPLATTESGMERFADPKAEQKAFECHKSRRWNPEECSANEGQQILDKKTRAVSPVELDPDTDEFCEEVFDHGEVQKN